MNKEKIGSMGWSVGGKWSLLLAVNDPFLAACVVNYGSMPTDPATFRRFTRRCWEFSARTIVIVLEATSMLSKTPWTSAHKSFAMKIYRDAGHDFENPGQ